MTAPPDQPAGQDDELVARLRARLTYKIVPRYDFGIGNYAESLEAPDKDCQEAAARIEALVDENTRLRTLFERKVAAEIQHTAEIARLTRERDEAIREGDRADADRSTAENELHDAEERFQEEVELHAETAAEIARLRAAHEGLGDIVRQSLAKGAPGLSEGIRNAVAVRVCLHFRAALTPTAGDQP